MTSVTAKLHKLEAIEERIGYAFASEVPGEEFHPSYKKNPKVWRLLTRSDMALERELKKYFGELTVRVHDYINWGAYNKDLVKASVLDWITADWKPERLLLKVILTKTLTDAIEAGGLLTEEDTKIDIGWSSTNETASEFMRKYTLKLAGSLTETTIDRVKEGLRTAFEMGEDQKQAAARLDEILNDPKRAATIAHTEAVRAFTGGRLAVGATIGATQKQWDATLGACEICAPLDGQIVGLDEDFDGEFDAPPAHPNCRCLVKILMPEEGDQPEPYDDPFDIFKDFFKKL